MKILFFSLVVSIVFISALQVVIAQHQARRLFVEIQFLEKTRDALNEEWTRLLLEQSTWATNARIETVSRNELGMYMPDINSLVILKK
jgi:cell division protein FtsL